MKKLLRSATAGAIFAAAAVAGSCPAFAANWSIYNHQSAPQFATSVSAKNLADKITKDTDGDVKVRMHLAGTLQIATSDITSAVAQNVIQIGDDLFFSGNVPIGAILKLPFLVQSYEEFEKASAIVQPYVEKAYDERGVVVLAGYAYPMQYIWSRKDIGSLDAISGSKLRVASPEQSEFVRRFGGSSVSIGASEVPAALDRGVVDGLITGSVGADLWQDMLSHGFLAGLNYNNAYIIANKAAFEKLSPENQAKVRAAAVEAANWNTETMRGEDAEIIERLGKDRMKIVKPTTEESAKAEADMTPYWDEWAAARGDDAVKLLAEIRQVLGR